MDTEKCTNKMGIKLTFVRQLEFLGPNSNLIFNLYPLDNVAESGESGSLWIGGLWKSELNGVPILRIGVEVGWFNDFGGYSDVAIIRNYGGICFGSRYPRDKLVDLGP